MTLHVDVQGFAANHVLHVNVQGGPRLRTQPLHVNVQNALTVEQGGGAGEGLHVNVQCRAAEPRLHVNVRRFTASCALLVNAPGGSSLRTWPLHVNVQNALTVKQRGRAGVGLHVNVQGLLHCNGAAR